MGYAFGRLSTAETRPHSNKRKASDRVSDTFSQLFTPTKPTERFHPTSAPTSKLPKPGVLRRPQSFSFPRNSTYLPDTDLAGRRVDESNDWRMSALGLDNGALASESSPGAAAKETGTAKASWVRRLSTFSSLHNESLISTSRPGTPSLTFSYGSGAPIVSAPFTSTTPRNKLVKRASSQRALHRGDSHKPGYLKPSLRRPATSHQRSADIQEQLFQNTTPIQHNDSRPSFQQDDGSMDNLSDGEAATAQLWQPLFQCRNTILSKETPTKSGLATKSSGRTSSTKRVLPVPGDRAILLKATSITTSASEETSQPVTDLTQFRDESDSPMTQISHAPSSTNRYPESAVEQESKLRGSFALGEVFSTPSPSTWKLPRTGSFRRKNRGESTTSGRRVASAPQPLGGEHTPSKYQRNSASRYPTSRRLFGSSHVPAPSVDTGVANHFARSPSSPLPPLNRLSAFEIDLPGSAPSYPASPQSQYKSSPSSQTSPSPAFLPNSFAQAASRGRSHRPSGAPSDQASTLVGSDNDNSRGFVGDGDEIDFRSDTVYDSVRTGATGSSHSGARGPRIESVFDPSPPPELLKQNLTALQENLSHTNTVGDFITEEEESVRTPGGMTETYDRDISKSSRYSKTKSSSLALASSPPPIPLTLKHRTEAVGFDDVPVEEDWSIDELESASPNRDPTGPSPFNLNLPSESLHLSPLDEDVQIRLISEDLSDLDDKARADPFKWSERSQNDKEIMEGSSPRPKTVHGNQNTERGSRSSGRRGPSAMHLRSQSVPLSPDNSSHRNLNSSSKLDAWILGSKGVSEDWDGDFEFDEPSKAAELDSGRKVEANAKPSNGMLVPKAILERQASVHGQFGQVKELTLLVEELKRLRQKASTYSLIHGQASELWKEAEGIINLATLDDEDHDYLPPRSPSTPSFDFDVFDDEAAPTQRQPTSHLSDVIEDNPSSQDHIDSPQIIRQGSPAPMYSGTPPPGRPRKDSAAKAKSVLEHIHQQRNPNDPPLKDIKSRQKKLPFDTTSLRDLVTRAGVVTRALKEIIRKVENPDDPYQTPERPPSTPPDPPFSQIFQQSPSSPRSSKSPRIGKSSSHNNFMGGSMTGNDNDINGHMKMMTVV
ncbi:hypothetical protein MMC19_001706 [Ptychographa xylographoides]|nr:hypothetical protein [Ptychographa xylographoides]